MVTMAGSHGRWKQIPEVSLQAYFKRSLYWEFKTTWSFIETGPGEYHRRASQVDLLLPQVFDVQRKITYKNLSTWYTELREFRPEIPCIVVANKIDDRPVSYLLSTADIKMTQKSFNFARKFSLPLYFVSAADGTNVVKLFNDAIRLAVSYKQNSRDFMDEVLQELENITLEQKEQEMPDKEPCGRIESPSPS
ncbi:rab-like protein 2B isoform X5 [Hippopotamus amphibius kiboko]|uniref:rab-like protein 2B isoform X5 n=1 Tax=Hippopotamus amphibius kiboko TaxID=575201 RepID=UPI002597C119|nr:rab-like protein 2B isoform X5 [Hippopotamus amphibius kiboko]